MDIDWNSIDRSKIKTNSGYPVRIYATDGAFPHPIHGAFESGSGWEISTWAEDGNYIGSGGGSFNSHMDLDFTDALPTEPAAMVKNAEGL